MFLFVRVDNTKLVRLCDNEAFIYGAKSRLFLARPIKEIWLGSVCSCAYMVKNRMSRIY